MRLSQVAVYYLGGISAKPLKKALPEDLDFFLSVKKRLGKSLEFMRYYELLKADLLEDPEISGGLVEQNEYDLRLLNLVYHPN